MTKRIFSILVSAALLLCLLPVAAFPVAAEENTYIDYDAETGEKIYKPIPDDAKEITVETAGETVTLEGGFYTVSDVQIIERIVCSGDTEILLMGGSTLLLNAGIFLEEDVSLTIYEQGTKTSSLDIVNAENAATDAGIHAVEGATCGDITINGGYFDIAGGEGSVIGAQANSNCGDIRINGGEVYIRTKEMVSCVGIGAADGGTCGNIICNGGAVGITNENGNMAVGIGASNEGVCGNIENNGAPIEICLSADYAVAFGANNYGSCGNIALNTWGEDAYTFAATQGLNGTGVGSCYYGTCQDIIINKGMVQLMNDTPEHTTNNCLNIGASIHSICGNITILDGLVFAIALGETPAIGATNESSCKNISIKNSDLAIVTAGNTSAVGANLESTTGTISVEPKEYCYTGTMEDMYRVETYGGERAIVSFDAEPISLNPTCTAPGYKPYVHSENVGGNFEAEMGGKMIESLSKWKETDGYLPPLDHVFGYKDEDTHICAYCGLEEEHDLTEGKCVCGLGEMPATYYDYDEEKNDFVGKGVPASATIFASSDSFEEALPGGYYVIFGTINCKERICFDEDAHLIFAEGAKLIAPQGIGLGDGASLTIYNESLDEGKMGTIEILNPTDNSAAIGSQYGNEAGNITLNGGNYTLKGNFAAALGGGYGGTCGNITINGANVKAAGDYAAGIGGARGGACGTITIRKSDIEATSSGDEAAIGSSSSGDCGDIYIKDSKVKANGSGAGIGNGQQSACGNIYIYNSEVDATGGASSAAIGTAHLSIFSEGKEPNILIDGGKIHAIGGASAAAIGSGYFVPCGDITIKNAEIIPVVTNNAAGIGSGYGGSCGDIAISGCTTTVTGGKSSAGIGSGFSASCGDITLSDSTITATGGDFAAGIGTGYNSSCGDITICSGNVTATAGSEASGIGSGFVGASGLLNIQGGTVKATGGKGSPGIGAGYQSDGCDGLIISGGNVTAIAGEGSAAIECRGDQAISLQGGSIIAAGAEGQPAIKHTESSLVHQLSINEDFLIYGGTKSEDVKRVMNVGDRYLELFFAEINEKPAACLETGFKAYCLNPIDSLYYEAFENGICIGDAAALTKWITSFEEGCLPALGHNWVSISETEHQCASCKEVGNHVDEDEDYICDICPYVNLEKARGDAKAPIQELVGDNPSEMVKIIRDAYYASIDAETNPKSIFAISDSAITAIMTIQQEEEKEAVEAYRESVLEFIHDEFHEFYGDTLYKLVNQYNTLVEEAKSIEEIDGIMEEGYPLMQAAYEEEFQANLEYTENMLKKAAEDNLTEELAERITEYCKELLANAESYGEVDEITDLMLRRIIAISNLLADGENYQSTEAKEIIEAGISAIQEASRYEIDLLFSEYARDAYEAELGVVKQNAKEALKAAANGKEDSSETIKAVLDANLALIDATGEIEMVQTILEKAISIIEKLAEEEVLYGDVNGDKLVDLKDVLVLRRHAAGQAQEGFIEKAADVNVDGNIDMKDILMLRKFIANAIDKLGA